MNKRIPTVIRVLFRITAWLYWLGLGIWFIAFAPIWVVTGDRGYGYRFATLQEIPHNIYNYFASGDFLAELYVSWVLFLPAILYFTGRYIYQRFYR